MIAACAAAVAAAPASAVAAARTPRPLVALLSAPSQTTAGAPPAVSVRISERPAGTVYLQALLTDSASGARVLAAVPAHVRTGAVVRIAWPAGALLPAGSYMLTVFARDTSGHGVLRPARYPGRAMIMVTAPVKSAPEAEAAQAGAPTVAQTVADGAVFPVAGPHNFGGPENRFGAPRGNHIHQGQDILTAEGTPDVAPFPGTITWTSYQAEGAGWYAVEHTNIGLDLMFAHCEAGSLAVSAEEKVLAGQKLCLAGQTGDATTPHLHFEMWVGGWQSPTGHPIDPLPYLLAWEAAAA